MVFKYFVVFISFDCRPILVKPSDGETHPDLIIWRNRAFLLKGFAEGEHFPCPIYQEVASVEFWAEMSPKLRSTDLPDRHPSQIPPVIFEEEGESSWWFTRALELIREAGLSPDQLESGG